MSQLLDENIKSCPNCAQTLQAGAAYCRFCRRGLSKLDFKQCLYCAEMVRKAARLCRFCRCDLSGPSGSPPQGAPVPRVPINPVPGAEIALPLPKGSEDNA